MTKIVAVVLILAMMNYVLPTTAFADGAKAGTTEEAMDYAQREAMAVGLENFEGGGAEGILITILIIVALVYLIWYLMDHSRYGMAPAEKRALADSGDPVPATGGRCTQRSSWGS